MECPTTKRIAFALILVAFSSGTSSCYYDNYEDLYGNTMTCDTTSVTFSQDIKAMMGLNCEGCHSGANSNGGLILNGHQNISSAALNGSLIDRMTRANGDPLLMPPADPLSDCDISTLRAWISEGALNN